MSETAGGYRLGIDIGGTFTDVVLLAADGLMQTRKVLSTPDDYAAGVIEGALEPPRDRGRRARRDHRDRARDHGRVEHGPRGAQAPGRR